MKKQVFSFKFLVVLLFVSFILFSGSVSAASAQDAFKPIVQMVAGALTQVYESASPLISALIGETAPTSIADGSSPENIFLAKILLIILLIAIVSYALNISSISALKSDSKFTHWTISIVVAVLAVRTLNADLVKTILIPYSTFAVAVSSGLIFCLYFFLVNKGLAEQPAIVRRVAWILFGTIFLIIWVIRSSTISDPSILSMYPLVVLLSFLMAWMDGTVQGFFNRIRSDKAESAGKTPALNHINSELSKIHENFAKQGAAYIGVSPAGRTASGMDAYKEDKKYYEDLRKELLKS